MSLVNFNKDFFYNNRQHLRQAVNEKITIAVSANGLVQRGADSSYTFSQDANFWYLTGINEPDIILVMEPDREYLIVPIREGVRVTFDGQIDQTEISSICGISDIENEVSGWKRFDYVLKKSKSLATLAPAPAYIEQYGMYSNPARARFIERINRHVEDLEISDIRGILAKLRMIKQPSELKAIVQAINITNETIKEVLNKRDYKYEYEIEADITRGFRFRGALGHAFEPIVAGGERACTLHNISNSSRLSPDELTLLDVGASVNNYAADITRIYLVSQPSTRQKEIIDAVYECQQYAISLLKPGILLKNYERKVVKFLGSKLKQLGLIDSLNEEAIRKYYPHATSHFLGLNVHDVGDYSLPLQPGVVMTVEPGIYIEEESIGVRIEDDILITENGAKVLSDDLPNNHKLN